MENECQAKDPACSEPRLRAYSTCEDKDVRMAVAENPSTTASILRNMCSDSEVTVRRLVAKNKRTPSQGLEILAWDENPSVRAAVAENPDIPAGLISLLSNDEEMFVRSAIKRNHSPIEDIKTNSQFRCKTKKQFFDAGFTNISYPDWVITRGLSDAINDLYNDEDDDSLLYELLEDCKGFTRDAYTRGLEIKYGHHEEIYKEASNKFNQWLEIDILKNTVGRIKESSVRNQIIEIMKEAFIAGSFYGKSDITLTLGAAVNFLECRKE